MAGGGVVVDTGEGVVVVANIIYFIITLIIHLPTPDSPVTSVVTVTSPLITAKNPVLLRLRLVLNLTVMLVPVNGPGRPY